MRLERKPFNFSLVLTLPSDCFLLAMLMNIGQGINNHKNIDEGPLGSIEMVLVIEMSLLKTFYFEECNLIYFTCLETASNFICLTLLFFIFLT